MTTPRLAPREVLSRSAPVVSTLPADTGEDAVTGAFGYSGAAITALLAASGRGVRTLTGHPDRAPDGSSVTSVHPLDFEDTSGLVRALEGVTTLYNTYWVRFAHGGMDHQQAALNCRTLFFAARRAGVRRIVHVSILHPGLTSPYSYFRGKALAERWLAESEVAHTVVRPAVLFGGDGVLLNNIAWLLRRFPVFAVGGAGGYRVRPIHVEDLAALCVACSAGGDDTVVDAVGPEAPTFDDLVRQLHDAVGSRSRIVHLPGGVLPPLAWALGRMVGDVVLTGDEFRAMADGLADSDAPAAGPRRLSEWIRDHADDLGRQYANELDRHFRS